MNSERPILYINDTYVSSIEELKNLMRHNYLDKSFRRCILAFYKDDVLNNWFEDREKMLNVQLKQQSTDIEAYDCIHQSMLHESVKDQISTAFYDYLSFDSYEYESRGNVFTKGNVGKGKSEISIPRTSCIRFSFKVKQQDNDSITFRFNEQTKTIELKDKKKGELIGVEFNNLDSKQNEFTLKQKDFLICRIKINAFSLHNFNENLPKSIKGLKDNLQLIDKFGKQFMITKTMITTLQWAEVTHNDSIRVDENPMNFSRSACNEFIKQINKLCNVNFRLPTEEQWGLLCMDNKNRKEDKKVRDVFDKYPEYLRNNSVVIKGRRESYEFRSCGGDLEGSRFVGCHLVLDLE